MDQMRDVGKRYQINEIFAIIVGMVSTMPIVTIPGARMSLFTICLPLFTIYNSFQILQEGKVYINRKNISTLLIVWLICALFSSVCGIIYYSVADKNVWTKTVSGYIPKILLYLLLAISVKDKENVGRALLKGIIYGAVINCIMAMIDALFYYGFGFSLINRMFKSYIDVHQGTLSGRYNMISLAFGGVIRSGGFNFDPAHIGMLAPVVMIYGASKRRMALVIISALAIVSSLSTTALVCSMVGIVFVMVAQTFKINIVPTKRSVFWGIVSIIIASSLYVRFGSYLSRAIGNMVNRVNRVYIYDNGGSNIRISYLANTFVAMSHQGLKMLTGTGFNTASEGYIAAGNELSFNLKITNPFDMENTYLSYLFDLGIIGVGVYIGMLVKYIKVTFRNIKNNASDYALMAFAGLLASALCGFFYHYTLFSCQILVLIGTAALFEKKHDHRERKNG